MVNSGSKLVLMEIATRAPPRCYLGLALPADRLLAHLALGAAREDAEPRLLAEETQLQGKVFLGSEVAWLALAFFPYPGVLDVLPDFGVVDALQLGLGQRRADVRHLVQPEVERLHPVALPPNVAAQRRVSADLAN